MYHDKRIPSATPGAGAISGLPRHPQPVRARDIYPAEHFALGARPDTQPVSMDEYAALKRHAAIPRRATPSDRAARAALNAVVYGPLGGLATLAAGLLGGGHVAALVGGFAAAHTLLRVALGAGSSRPL